MLKPKTDKDCPHCQAAKTFTPSLASLTTQPLPWAQRKGRGGRKKIISTQHHFCPYPKCDYYLNPDEDVHALVGYGTHGKTEPIQYFFCQACRHKFTSLRHTLLYRLKTPTAKIKLALTLLALGLDPSALEEALLIRETTLRIWLTRSGHHAQKLHEKFFTALQLTQVQLDELWAEIKQTSEAVWVWLACDAKTKIIPVLQLGPRTQAQAFAVVHELKSRLAAHCVPIFTTDGLKHYFYALTAHFGEWVRPDDQTKPIWLLCTEFCYAQVLKQQRRFRLIKMEPRLLWGDPTEFATRLKACGLTGHINTAFVERLNLTIRRGVAKLARRTWATAQHSAELTAHLQWWRVSYHFVRTHESLRSKLTTPIPQPGRRPPRHYQKVTPAMAAGLTTRPWSVIELLSFPLAEAVTEV